MPLIPKKVIVGLSGGVDSAVSAWLLKKKYESVEAVFMKNWEEADSQDYCASAKDLEDAKSVCKHLDIPLNLINFSAEYWEKVFEYFLEEYRVGRTPNPDILCNKEIKFKAFWDYAHLHLKADYMATGHYADIKQDLLGTHLMKPVDREKDQTYFLYAISEEALSHTLFPLAKFSKTAVRAMAKEAKLPNFAKKDSTGICFIGPKKFKLFLETYLGAKPGEIYSLEGQYLGQHNGLMYHTIGQRQGLNIGGLKDSTGEPWYVAKKDLKHNRLIVVPGANHPALYKDSLTVSQLYFINSSDLPKLNALLSAKIRYRQSEQICSIISWGEQTAQVQFQKPQRAVTPGQSIVFYDGNRCLGGGVILE